MTETTLSERLRAERKRLGLTQAAAALACGIARETWSRYEGGELTPGIEPLAGFARAGADIQFVVTGARDYAPPPPLSAEEATLLALWRQAGRETKTAALGALAGVGAARQARTQQIFNAGVGQVVETIRDVTIHQDLGTYQVPKKAAKPAPKK